MLVAQQSHQMSSPNMEDSLDTHQHSDIDKITLKDEAKKSFFTPLNILIILSLIAIMGAGTYYLFNVTSEQDIKSGINGSHEKIIQNADSSKKDSSNSQSSSSKSTTGTTKPHQKSLPATKGIISSNPALQNNKGDGPGEDDEDNGEKRDKKLKKASSTEGESSNEQDSDDYDEQQQEQDNQQGLEWVNTNLQGNGAPPLVGNARP